MASVAVTVKVDEPPVAMETGSATILTVGADLLVTVTIAIADELPPAPVAAAV